MKRLAPHLGELAFLCGLGPQIVAGVCFLVARKLWRWAS
jgi:hypothetical protein